MSNVKGNIRPLSAEAVAQIAIIVEALGKLHQAEPFATDRLVRALSTRITEIQRISADVVLDPLEIAADVAASIASLEANMQADADHFGYTLDLGKLRADDLAKLRVMNGGAS